MNGAGNDFVVLDNRDGRSTGSSGEQIAAMCDRQRGVGAPMVCWRSKRRAGFGADFRMRYYNADGGEAEMCGNGARCFARFRPCLPGRRRRLENATFETIAGPS
jgi:diaminopimelate epimerase